jgi:hypothetical protein
LISLGVPPEKLRAIIVTHWHDDHIKGIGALYEWASEAHLAMPFVRTAKELIAYVKARDPGRIGLVTSGVDEISNIGRTLRERHRQRLQHCQADLTVFRKDSVAGRCEVTVTALSPSQADVDDFIVALGGAADEQEMATRLEPFEPNAISVATWVKFGSEAVLLGADLVNHSDLDRGWNAVTRSTRRPGGRASFYKVAHHGSENAHHPAIWTDLLADSRIAALAPFNKGVGVPKRDDVNRILGLTSEAFSTTRTPFRKYRDGTPIVRTALEHDNIHIRAGTMEIGAVRMRRPIGSDGGWAINLDGDACHLKDFVTRD